MPELNHVPSDLVDATARGLHRRQVLAALADAGLAISPGGGPDTFLATDAEACRMQIRFGADGAIGLTTADGRTATRWFDAEGRLRRLVDAAGVDLRIDHSGGEMRLDRGPYGVHVIRQDPFGLLISVEFPDGSRSAIDWEAPGGEVITDRAGQASQRLRDETGTQVGATDARGGRTEVRIGAGPASQFIERRSPAGRVDRFQLSAAGELSAWLVNGREVAVAEGHSVPGQPAHIRYADGRWARYAANAGKIVAAEGPGGKIQIQRDAAGRLIAETQNGAPIRYGRDRTGLLTSIALPDGSSVGFGYDASAMLDRVVDWDGGVTRIAWSASGQLRALAHPNGAVTEIEADPVARIQAMRTRGQGGKALHEARYEYDQLDRLVMAEDGAGRHSYSYDLLDRLTGVESSDPRLREAWTLDASGNRTLDNGRPFTADPDNKVSGAGVDAIAYDALGRAAELRLPNGRRGRLSHDGRGQLVRIDFDNGDVADYGYDPFGRRVWKRVNGRVTRYAWAGTTLASEIRDPGSGWTRRDHLFLPDLYFPVAMRIDGRIVRLHCDRRGAPVAATSANGAPVWQARLKAFGEAVVDVGQIDQPWRLAGQYCDEESGLHYNLARHFHPGLGRYLSEDPLFDPATRGNPFLYAAGDPFGRADPTGELVIPLAIIAAIAIGAAVGALIGAAVKAYETRDQDWNADRWKEIGKGALVGGIAGGVGGAIGFIGVGLAGGAAASIGALMAVGAVDGAITSVVQDCAEAKLYDQAISGQKLLKNALFGAVLGAATGGIGGLIARRLSRMKGGSHNTPKVDPRARALAIASEGDFSTPKGRSVFYSGPGNRDRALSRIDDGFKPIDATPGGQALNSENLYSKYNPLRNEADTFWGTASEQYARGASGDVTAYVNGASPDRVFATKELPLLLENPNVTTINGVPRDLLLNLEKLNPGSAFEAVTGMAPIN